MGCATMDCYASYEGIESAGVRCLDGVLLPQGTSITAMIGDPLSLRAIHQKLTID